MYIYGLGEYYFPMMGNVMEKNMDNEVDKGLTMICKGLGRHVTKHCWYLH